jgi:hypothetical protein
VTARRALAVVGLVAFALQARPAHAGGNLQIRHPSSPTTIISTLWDTRRLPIRWVLSNTGLPGSGIDIATLEAEVQSAFDAWQAVPTSAVAFTYGGRVDARNANQDGAFGLGIDGRNLITFTDPDLVFPAGVLALSLTTAFTGDTVVTAANADLDGDGTADLPTGTYAAGTIFDSDIAFNSGVAWSVSGAEGTNDVRAVALHESGHMLGLCHSAIRTAVMWPFQPADVASVRVPSPDDVAWVSAFYPSEPAQSAAFGRIAGTVTNGVNGFPVLGAHVYAVDPSTQAAVVGGYSGDDGAYLLPGLPPGNWLVAVEPLDGDPPGTEPFRINHVIASTLDTSFPDEFRDADEGPVETDPTAASAVPLTAGTTVNDVDIVTNTLTLPGTSVTLPAGFSLFAWPVAVPAGTTAFDLLDALGGPGEVTSVDRFHAQSGAFERAEYAGGVPAGVDFPIRRGEGYAVHTVNERIASFTGATDCPALDLARGLNLIGVPCRPPGYTAFALLEDLGTSLEVDRVARFDPEADVYRVARYGAGGEPGGDDFPIANGEGYLVVMRAPKGGVRLPRPGREVTPLITGLSPGRGVPGTVVAILGEGFDPDPAKNLVTFNGVPSAAIVATTGTVTATVPGAATSGPVRVTVAGKPSNGVDFVVEPAVVQPPGDGPTELVSGQTAEATISADGEQDRYTFTALAGSVVTIAAKALNPGVPDLLLVLEDPFGAIATVDDNSGGGTEPRINNFVLTATGTHTIVVSNVPGSGTGPYRVSLTIATRPAETQLSILSGDVQTGEPGTELVDPMAVFATGPTGAALSGIPVTVVATEVDVEGLALPGPIDAGTIVLATNASGIVTIKTTLPNKSGFFDIQVVIPGAKKPVTFKVASTAGRVTRITTSGNDQHGAVDTPLAMPLAVVLATATNTPVAGAAVQFKLVSGGGTLTPTGPRLSDAAGRVAVTWKLGKLVTSPQIVAATVPGRSQPILFTAVPEAGTAQKIVADKSTFTRITLGTSILNAMFVRVLDQFGNPVPGVTINYGPLAGLTIEPGLRPDGTKFTDFKTDADGLHIAAVRLPLKSAPGGTCSDFVSDLPPTIDEFGNPRLPPYSVVATAAGTSLGQTYPLHVDMGPRLVSEVGLSVSGPMGVVRPVRFGLQRVERFDRNGDFDFRPDPFDCFTAVAVRSAVVTVSAHRVDRRDETAAGRNPTRVVGNDVPTDQNGIASFDLTLGDVPGVVSVVGNIPTVRAVFVRAKDTFAEFSDPYQLSSGIFASVQGPKVVVEVQDHGSGVDLKTVVAKLNGTVFFDGATPTPLSEFPDRLEVVVGGKPLKSLDANLVRDAAFDRVIINYFPSRPNVQANNTIDLPVFKDRAGNPAAQPKTTSFPWP